MNNIQFDKSPQDLLVVSHVVHYRHKGRLFAYGPYVREIDIWADLFPETVIAAPCRAAPPPGDCLPFSRPNISILPQPETGGKDLKAKLTQVLRLPALAWSLGRAMRQADAIHVRCPGNLGLLGALMGPLFSRRLVAKYAGQWNSYAGEPWSVRLQRAILRSPWWRGPVTVYGQWPNQPLHVVPFFTSMMTAAQMERAIQVAKTKEITRPLHVLFAGRLVPVKRVGVLLEAVREASNAGLDLEVAIVGQGSEQGRLRDQANRLGIDDRVQFVGGLPYEKTLAWFEWAHCLVLPSSHSEGWPKVIAEGMSHGVVSIAVGHGHVPAMLHGRGIVLKTGSSGEIAEALLTVARRPEEFQAIARKASAWASQYSLEGLRAALAALLAERWNTTFSIPGGEASPPARMTRFRDGEA